MLDASPRLGSTCGCLWVQEKSALMSQGGGRRRLEQQVWRGRSQRPWGLLQFAAFVRLVATMPQINNLMLPQAGGTCTACQAASSLCNWLWITHCMASPYPTPSSTFIPTSTGHTRAPHAVCMHGDGVLATPCNWGRFG